MFCTNCGKEVNEGEKFCSNCGASIGVNYTENNVNPEFDVILMNVGSNQTDVVKVIREITGLGLKDVQKIIDNLPKAIKQNVIKEEAENMKARLSEIGAIAELQNSVNKSNHTIENKTEMKKENNKNPKKKIFSIFGIILVILIGIGYAGHHKNTNTIPTSTSEISTNNKVENNEQNFEYVEYPEEDIEQDVWDGDTEQDFWDNETWAYIEANQERTGGEESQEPTTNDNDKSFTTADEFLAGIKVHEEDTTKNSNGTQQYYDDEYLKMIGFKKCLDEDVSIKSAYNSGQCVHTEELTKNSDGSVSVYVKLYIKEAYEYSRMYGMPLSEIASADVTLTKEEATR